MPRQPATGSELSLMPFHNMSSSETTGNSSVAYTQYFAEDTAVTTPSTVDASQCLNVVEARGNLSMLRETAPMILPAAPRLVFIARTPRCGSAPAGLRHPKPVAIGDQVDGWRVSWIGGWDRCRVFFVVMMVREYAGSRPRELNPGTLIGRQPARFMPSSCPVLRSAAVGRTVRTVAPLSSASVRSRSDTA